MPQEFNFVDPKISSADNALFMGPFSEDDGPFMDVLSGWSMAHIMHAAGIFPSIKQAKSNGWDKPIASGFSSFVVGKAKTAIFILTAFD